MNPTEVRGLMDQATHAALMRIEHVDLAALYLQLQDMIKVQAQMAVSVVEVILSDPALGQVSASTNDTVSRLYMVLGIDRNDQRGRMGLDLLPEAETLFDAEGQREIEQLAAVRAAAMDLPEGPLRRFADAVTDWMEG